jgi:transcriptional regulator with XRE-family HTH domain
MLVDAEKVRTMRLENGWTQEQFAELCGLSVRTIQRLEKTGTASLETTNALAAVLHTERRELLVRDGMRPARTEFSLRAVIVIAALTFALGMGIGLAT